MKNLNKWCVIAGVALMAGVGSNALAQQRGNFDPAQFQQRRMDALKEQMEVKEDSEWSAMQPLIQKVMDSQRAVFADRMRGAMRGFGGGRGGGGAGGGGGATADNAGDNGGGRRRGGGGGGFGGEPSPEAQALEKAVESKASASETKAALAKYMEARKAKEADLAKAQDELRKVLTVRQEAVATVNGLL
jgi:hypothetical protein